MPFSLHWVKAEFSASKMSHTITYDWFVYIFCIQEEWNMNKPPLKLRKRKLTTG